MLVRSLLHSKVMHGGRARLPSSETLDGVRRQVAQGMARLLKLGSLGGGASDDSSADVDLLLAPEEAGGGGVPPGTAAPLP